MTTSSKIILLLIASVFLFISVIVSFSTGNAQQDVRFQDGLHGKYIIAQAPKLLGQKQAPQPQVTKSKQDSTSRKKPLRAKAVADDDDDDEDEDDDDDDTIQPLKDPKAISTTSQKPVSKPPLPSTPQATPGQVSAKPPVQQPQQTSPAPVVPTAPSEGRPTTPQSQNAQQQARPQPFIPPRPAPSRGSISLNFDDADVYQVIQTIFGDVLRANYIVDPRVKGRVTFRSVAPIPTDQVLPVMETILRINAIGVVEDGGLYRIVPISEVAREPAPVGFGRDPEKIPSTGKSLVQVVPVLFLQSSEVIKLITPFLSTNAVVIDVPKTNQIIIVDTDASVRRILQFLGTFDNEQQKKKQAQVYVYAVQNGKAKNVANLLQQIFLGARPATTSERPQTTTATTTPRPPTQQATQTPPPQQQLTKPPTTGTGETLVSDMTRIFADEILNSVIILATPEDYKLIKETIDKIDIQPRQVMIEGIVAQINLTDNLSLGLSYAFKTQFKISPDSVMQGTLGLNTGKLGVESLPTSGFTFVGTVGDDYRAVINALATQSRAKVIAAPHILVTDNREARIQVGQQVPIVTSTSYDTTVTSSRTSTIQYKDIGIILKVTPQVNESGLVALDLAQEVSTYSTIELGLNETTIILNKAEATTNVVVKDGETIIIGGLIREDTDKSRSGVPWLSKIPLFGYLFGNTTDNETRQEYIILLTPRVIKNQNDAKEMTNDYVDRMTKSGKGKITTKELFGTGRQGTVKKDLQTQPNVNQEPQKPQELSK
ncbi:MAG TPA: secretin N-terminal domain-containing protein [Syntrophorhabdus sp.]|nr:secretin N-terminal domain-containing protein [Syntrophorhabdus sp.]